MMNTTLQESKEKHHFREMQTEVVFEKQTGSSESNEVTLQEAMEAADRGVQLPGALGAVPTNRDGFLF